MREYRVEFCREQDSARRQEIFDRVFLLMAARWRQLLGLIIEERDPVQLQAMIEELGAILLERKATIEAIFEIGPKAMLEERLPSSRGPTEPKILHKAATSSSR